MTVKKKYEKIDGLTLLLFVMFMVVMTMAVDRMCIMIMGMAVRYNIVQCCEHE